MNIRGTYFTLSTELEFFPGSLYINVSGEKPIY